MNIKEEQVMQIMQPVMEMNKVQLKAERTLRSMKRSNEDMKYQIKEIFDEREKLKQELREMMGA